MHTAARAISILLHPLFMPVFALGLAFQVDPHVAFFLPPELRWLTLGMLALMTIAFPLVSAYLLLRSGLISSLEMPHAQERIAPYAMTLIYYGMAWYLLRQVPLHPAVILFFSGIIVALLLTLLITLRWKISAHMVGIGGVVGVVGGLSVLHGLPLLVILALTILLAGLLGTARLLTSDHTPAQIHVGMALGFVCTYAPLVLEVRS